MTNTTTDWKALEAKAENMTDAQLWGAIQDIRKTLDAADAMDRATGSDQGGRYRDEASVLHQELKFRQGEDR